MSTRALSTPSVAPAFPSIASRARLGAALLGLVALSSAAACGGAAEGGSGRDSGTVGLGVGDVAVQSIEGTSPQAGRYFLTIQVTLLDASASFPVPAGFLNYALTTDNGLEIMPSTASSAVPTPCAADTSVATGAEYTCTLAFEIPAGDSPKLLTYDDQRGDTATAPIAYTVPDDVVLCQTFVSFGNLAATACQDCIETSCQDVLVVQSNCPAPSCDACAPGDCTCAEACLGSCKPALDAFTKCVVDACASACR